MPNQPKTPLHAYRLPEDLYARLKRKAQDDRVTETQIVREALDAYLPPEQGKKKQ